MKFIKRVLGRALMIIGALAILSALGLIALGYKYAEPAPKLPERIILTYSFDEPISEIRQDGGMADLLGGGVMDLPSIIRGLDRAAQDPAVAGLIADLSEVSLNPAQIEDVRAAIARFVAKGKFAYAWAGSYGDLGPGNRQYWLASAFSKVTVQPLGQVGLTGPSLSQPYFRSLLDRLGVVPDVHQRYEYKGMAANVTEKQMPAPLRENYQTLLNDMHTNMVQNIAQSRHLKEDQLRRLIDQAPLSAQQALKGGLLDQVAYLDEISKEAREKAGAGADWVNLADYFVASSPPARSGKPEHVALVYMTGPIVTRVTQTGPFGEQEVTGADRIGAAMDAIVSDPAIRAIIIRMDSPGGSVTASESIRRQIEQAKGRGKYIVVSMGGTAASGGYWISTAADHILAQNSTLTGSIGVVSGKMALGPVSEALGVNWTTLTTGANSGIWAPDKVFAGAGLARIEASLDEVYAAFVDRVAKGRKLTPEQVDKLARGRVWAGSHAKELGLVDEIGGLPEAMAHIRKHLSLTEDQPLLVSVYPEPETPAKRIMTYLKQFLSGSAISPLGGSQLSALLHWVSAYAQAQSRGGLYYSSPGVIE